MRLRPSEESFLLRLSVESLRFGLYRESFRFGLYGESFRLGLYGESFRLGLYGESTRDRDPGDLFLLTGLAEDLLGDLRYLVGDDLETLFEDGDKLRLCLRSGVLLLLLLKTLR